MGINDRWLMTPPPATRALRFANPHRGVRDGEEGLRFRSDS